MAADPQEVVDFINQVNEAESTDRAEALDDLIFCFGQQWPTQIINSRQLEQRPALTINETNAYCRAIVNQIRQQRPRVKASPVGNGADVKIAQIITGIFRHVEENSDAANAYDIAAGFAVRIGRGWWRMRTDYIREDSFFQDIYVDPIENPFMVYGDPNSSLPDGADMERCSIADTMPKREFLREYPGAMLGSFTARGAGDVSADWVTKDDIRLAEYFRVERVKSRLIGLSSGDAFYEDELPPKELLDREGITVAQTRDSWKRKIWWCKVTAFERLEEKIIPGRFIPVVPVYGETVIIDGKRRRFGAVRDAKDPQRMVNYWQTTITESVALAPKAKWLIPEGADEGYEDEYRSANISAKPSIHYKVKTDGSGGVLKPDRIPPEPPPEGAMVAAMGASLNLQRVFGMFDPAVRGGAQRKSDLTLNAEQQQTDMANFHFYDNMTRSMKHTGRIALGWVPTVWDVSRIQRIIGEDGRSKLVTLNQKMDDQGIALAKVANDVTVGHFDVIMETGPGYNSKRQEAVANLMQLLATPLGEKVAGVADDIIIRTMDFPGADVVADRMAAVNPLAQTDEDSEIPPRIQILIKGLQMQIQQKDQALMAAGIEHKFGMAKEQIKGDNAARVALINTTAKAHNTEVIGATKRHDTEVRAITAQNVEEIRGFVQLFLKHIDTSQLREEIDARDREQRAKNAMDDASLPQPIETQGA